MTTPARTTHYRACNLCEAICGLEIEIEAGESGEGKSGEGCVASIRGDAEDPLSRGHLCPKAVALQDIHNDPDRLRRPLVRRAAGHFEEIEWDAAFDLAGERLRAVQEEHGHDAVALYLGNPNVHNYGSLLYGPLVIKALRTRHRYSATSVDQLPHHFAAYFMLGHQLLLPIPDVDRTAFFLILGANPAVSNGSLMTSPDIKKRLKEVQARGGRVVVVDPRRTETAKLADEHHFVRPGADAFLLLALVHTLFDEDLTRPGRLAAFTDGIEKVRQIAADFAPERVAASVGIEAAAIRGLARDFAAAESAVCYGRMGVSTQEFGALCQWLVNVMNVLTGNFDRPGGAMLTRPAVDVVAARGPGSFGRYRSRVRELPEFGGELPVATMAEDMLADGGKHVRALVTAAGNPVLSAPNGRQVDRALAGLDFMLSIDFYLNETTRHADLILPPTGPLEHDHYDLVFHLLAIRNTARYSPALFTPGPDQRHDWQIFLELARRLDGGGGGWAKRTRRGATRYAMAKLGPARLLDLALRQGPYGGGLNPFSAPFSKGLDLKRLRESPHGVDLGPLEPCLPERLRTRDKRLDLAPEPLVKDAERLRVRLEGAPVPANGELLLIGRRQVRSNNSWMHNHQRLMRGKDRCTLLVHPDDAARRGLEDGGRALVRSRIGSATVPVELSDAMMRGVVSLPHGWGHHRTGVRLRVATRQPGVSLNDLTDEARVDALSGNAAFSGVPVEVEAAADPGP